MKIYLHKIKQLRRFIGNPVYDLSNQQGFLLDVKHFNNGQSSVLINCCSNTPYWVDCKDVYLLTDDKPLRKGSTSCVYCKSTLLFKLWNGICRVIESNGLLRSKCESCKTEFWVKPND